MIESIEIENLRGIAHGKLEGLTPLTILVGPNGSGKSTILDALLLATSSDSNDAKGLVLSRRSGDHNQQKWLIRRNQNNQADISITTSTGINDVKIILDSTTNNISFESLKDKNHKTLGEALTAGTIPTSILIDHREYPKPRPLHELYSKIIEHGGRNFINSILSEIIPQFSNIEILTENQGHSQFTPLVHIVFQGTAGSVPVSLAGDGIHALVRMAMEIQLSQGLALIEEPEAHQHPATIRQIAKAIFASVRKNNQVILTTHSIELIDALVEQATTEEELKLVTIFRVKLRNGELLSSCTSGTDITFARNDIGEDLR